ncbi:MAG: hypothetical protein COC10_10010 [Sphingobium sp.]|nr:MAG: hypothetical protein COC10_10010 [Sphingobium sp.]
MNPDQRDAESEGVKTGCLRPFSVCAYPDVWTMAVADAAHQAGAGAPQALAIASLSAQNRFPPLRLMR